jgi:hypothetical protein
VERRWERERLTNAHPGSEEVVVAGGGALGMSEVPEELGRDGSRRVGDGQGARCSRDDQRRIRDVEEVEAAPMVPKFRD